MIGFICTYTNTHTHMYASYGTKREMETNKLHANDLRKRRNIKVSKMYCCHRRDYLTPKHIVWASYNHDLLLLGFMLDAPLWLIVLYFCFDDMIKNESLIVTTVWNLMRRISWVVSRCTTIHYGFTLLARGFAYTQHGNGHERSLFSATTLGEESRFRTRRILLLEGGKY